MLSWSGGHDFKSCRMVHVKRNKTDCTLYVFLLKVDTQYKLCVNQPNGRSDIALRNIIEIWKSAMFSNTAVLVHIYVHTDTVQHYLQDKPNLNLQNFPIYIAIVLDLV